MLGWRCWYQNFNGWRTQDLVEPVPPKRWADFANREDAEREARLQRAAGNVVCITPIPTSRVRRRKADGPKQTSLATGWPPAARRVT